MSKPSSWVIRTLLGIVCLAACGRTEAPDPSAQVTSADLSLLTDRSASLAAACSGCHAQGGVAIVSLENYPEDLMIEALLRYKSEENGTTVMHRLARGYSDDDIVLVSAFLSTEGAQQ